MCLTREQKNSEISKKITIYEEKVSLLYLEFEFIKQKHVKSGVSSMKN